MSANNISVENARIGFKNFSGKAGRFNPEGRKNFCVFLDTPVAQDLEKDGWNIRWLEPRDPDEERQAYVQVAVNYNQKFPPKIVLISSRGKSLLEESSVNVLDFAETTNIDLVIRPRKWDDHGTERIKAYIKSMYVTIVEDEFESKYYDVPDSAAESIGGCGHCETCDGSCHCNAH